MEDKDKDVVADQDCHGRTLLSAGCMVENFLCYNVWFSALGAELQLRIDDFFKVLPPLKLYVVFIVLTSSPIFLQNSYLFFFFIYYSKNIPWSGTSRSGGKIGTWQRKDFKKEEQIVPRTRPSRRTKN